MPLTDLRKDVNICESCYKLLYYPSSQPDCEYDEVYIDVEYDEQGNVISGMSDDDIKHLAQLDASPELPRNILSITTLRKPDSALPDDLAEFNTALLSPDTAGYEKSQLPGIFYNARQPRAIKCRIGQKYFIKAIKPPMISKIELYRLVSSSQAKTAQLICTVRYFDTDGTPEEGYYHPSILRFDQTLSTDTPTEVHYHEALVKAHDNKKREIPLNLSDSDLAAADFFQNGIFSCVSKAADPQHPNMNASAVNGNLLTRDFRIYHMGSLIKNTSSPYPDVEILPKPGPEYIGKIYHYIGPDGPYIHNKYYECKHSDVLLSLGDVFLSRGGGSAVWIGGAGYQEKWWPIKDLPMAGGDPDNPEYPLEHPEPQNVTLDKLRHFYTYLSKETADGQTEIPSVPRRYRVVSNGSQTGFDLIPPEGHGELREPPNNTFDTAPHSEVDLRNPDGSPSSWWPVMDTRPYLRLTGTIYLGEIITVYYNPKIKDYWDIVDIDDEVL